MEEPIFHHPFNVTKEEHREITLKQLHELVDRNIIGKAYPKEFGGQGNPGANVAGFAEMFHAHPSMQIKGGVQWGLFGSAILSLGNEEQHKKWLPGVLNMDLPGVYAMTEIGHGSDVGNIGTTATYIPEDDEFEIHTPFKAAWKEYLATQPYTAKLPLSLLSSSPRTSITVSTPSSCPCVTTKVTSFPASAVRMTVSRAGSMAWITAGYTSPMYESRVPISSISSGTSTNMATTPHPSPHRAVDFYHARCTRSGASLPSTHGGECLRTGDDWCHYLRQPTPPIQCRL